VSCSRPIGTSSLALLAVVCAGPALAQVDDQAIALTIAVGRPLEVVVDQRISIKRVGQPVTGTLVEPLYAYDRIVVPAGTRVDGHIAALKEPSTITKTRAMLSGDLSPKRLVVLQFDALRLDNATVPIHTVVTSEIPHLKRTTAPSPIDEAPAAGEGTVARAKHEAEAQIREGIAEAKRHGRDVLAEITQPGRTERLKQELVQRLPYHPQYIDAGTGYHAQFVESVDFGSATLAEEAPPGTRPAPLSILKARLSTMLDSASTPRGTTIHAVVTEPVFSADHRLIFPEGTVLNGEVTLATAARSLHRNGQLRFLFESVDVPSGDPMPLLASLQGVQASGDDRLAIDEEGGARATDSKTRFIAPTLAILALRANLDQHEHLDPDGDGHVIQSGAPGAQTVGGFMGLGLLGIPLSLASRPVSITLSVIGAARTTYTNVLGKGRDVRFPADTQIQLQLAPGASSPP
jgi:hypothetical protein